MAEAEWNGESLFKETSPKETIGGSVLQLVSGAGDVWHSLGTAALLWPGVALTARHVINESRKVYEFRETSPGHEHGEFDLFAYQFGSNDEVKQWKVAAVAESPVADLALLQLRGDPSWTDRQLRLSLLPPPVGSQVAAFGYAGSARFTGAKVLVDPGSHTTAGRVLDVYPLRRDATFGPCFHANVRLDDAMSGSPAFDQNGCLCGVGCSTIQPHDPGDAHSTFFSLLWPLIGLEIDWPWAARPSGTKYRLYDMFAANPGWVVGLDRFEFLDDGTLRFRI